MTDQTEDIRWQQRFSNYCKALNQLEKAVQLASTRELSDLEKQGLVQAFEFTYELAWNVIKDYFEYQGETQVAGSRDAFRLAFRRNLITDGETWMKMVKDRSLTSHTYNETTAQNVVADILNLYTDQFIALRTTFEGLTEHVKNNT